jgi:hypothetical protein
MTIKLVPADTATHDDAAGKLPTKQRHPRGKRLLNYRPFLIFLAPLSAGWLG